MAIFNSYFDITRGYDVPYHNGHPIVASRPRTSSRGTARVAARPVSHGPATGFLEVTEWGLRQSRDETDEADHLTVTS